jgi:hypothetical protein
VLSGRQVQAAGSASARWSAVVMLPVAARSASCSAHRSRDRQDRSGQHVTSRHDLGATGRDLDRQPVTGRRLVDLIDN